MGFLKNFGETVNNAVDFVVEKNKKFTKISKLKRLIKKESDFIIRAYITLGKHYYSDLRNVPDKEMQKICNDIDLKKLEIKKLKRRLVEVNEEQNYNKYRDLVDDEPIDIELYVDDVCKSDCGCIDDEKNACKCEPFLDDSSSCECIDEKEKVEKKVIKGKSKS